MRLIAPPLPPASEPSNTTSTPGPIWGVSRCPPMWRRSSSSRRWAAKIRVSYSSSVSLPVRSILSKSCTTSLGGGGRQGVDDAIDLAVGDHQRRAEREAVVGDRAGDHAELEHAVADLHRV